MNIVEQILTAILSASIGALVTYLYFKRKETNPTPNLEELTKQLNMPQNDGLPPTMPSWLALVKTIYSNKDLFKEFIANDDLILNIPADNGVYRNSSNFIKNQLIEELMDELPESSLLETDKPQGEIINYITDGKIN